MIVMDATTTPAPTTPGDDVPARTAATVTFLGRTFDMYIPTETQALALQMMTSASVDLATQVRTVAELVTSLFVTAEDRAWFLLELAGGRADAGDLTTLLRKLLGDDSVDGQTAPAVRKAPRKRAVRRA